MSLMLTESTGDAKREGILSCEVEMQSALERPGVLFMLEFLKIVLWCELDENGVAVLPGGLVCVWWGGVGPGYMYC